MVQYRYVQYCSLIDPRHRLLKGSAVVHQYARRDLELIITKLLLLLLSSSDKDTMALSSEEPPPPVVAAAAAVAAAEQQQQKENQRKNLHVVFVHLDWGIGGAEQLMLQLCTASVQAGHSVALLTTRCDQDHCFAQLKQPPVVPVNTVNTATTTNENDNGSSSNSNSSSSLYPYLHVWGQWIPSHIWGKGQALCSTLRLLYLAYRLARVSSSNSNSTNNHNTTTDGTIMQPADLIVLDVLPTPLWFLRYFTNASLLFYCHFPDQLLIRNSSSSSFSGTLFTWYRSLLNWTEERSMKLADTVTVNSNFTRTTVLQTFPSLKDDPLPVLYPALDIGTTTETESRTRRLLKNPNLIVSLNRFERKKNLGLLIEAVAWLKKKEQNGTLPPPPLLVMAGGYDSRNVENVQHRGELGALAQRLGVAVDFRHSISDAERRELLETAAVLVYTPANEHFGIVPLEAMFAGTAVVAANSGGPTETVRDGMTGYLCHDTTPAAFGAAIAKLLRDPESAARMGEAGRQHVIATFGPDRLRREWQQMAAETCAAGRRRRAAAKDASYYYRVVSPRTLLYLLEAAVMFVACAILTWILRHVFGILEPSQSILGGVRKAVQSLRNEL